MTSCIVVGGGFFGTAIAYYLATARGLRDVVLIEREADLFGHSSFANQARVHGGYHYPRSYTTAYRSRINMPRFRQEFGGAVFDRFEAIYAIARRNSKISVKQMERFCAEIGASLVPADDDIAALFNPQLIESSYVVEEQAFDADALREIMRGRLKDAGVEIWLDAEMTELSEREDDVVALGVRGGTPFEIAAPMLFNCTYSRLQHSVRGVSSPDFRLRHEIAELVLIEPPAPLAHIGVTLMDGPFFSTMPFPARGLHSLTHVRYTPHMSWHEHADVDPLDRLAAYPRDSRVEWMIRDAARYLPCLLECRPVSTLFEVKTVLVKSEGDDGRPILFERHGAGGRVFSILGGKIDNVYDILEALDREQLPQEGVGA